jgi:hypothetical protein
LQALSVCFKLHLQVPKLEVSDLLHTTLLRAFRRDSIRCNGSAQVCVQSWLPLLATKLGLSDDICFVFVIPAPFDVRISCGSTIDSYAPDSGYLWSRDMNYTGGSSGNLTTISRIAPQLNTIRYFELSDGPENCYNISVPNGQYLIRYPF